MNYKGHANAGLAVAIPATIASQFYFNDLKISLAIGAALFFGSLAPDLDTASKPSRYTAIVLLTWGVLSFLKIKYQTSFDQIKPLQWVFNVEASYWANIVFILFKTSKHRGFSHKYFMPLLLMIAAFYTGYIALIALAIGNLVHFSADKINPLEPKNWC